jgi:formylglycine-generating enzyme required for sulfatase activity
MDSPGRLAISLGCLVACGDAPKRSAVTAQDASCTVNGPGTTSCGASLESCCTSNEVPGGEYDRTYPYAGSAPVVDGDPAQVSAFRLDKYLITVGRFRQFVAASAAGWVPQPGSGKHTHLNGGQGLAVTSGGFEPGWIQEDTLRLATSTAEWQSYLSCDPNWATWTDAPGPNETLPINCITWYEAYAFCIWDGGFLPSEAEFEFAAAGGSEQRTYPWGTTDPGTASAYAITNCYFPNGPASPGMQGNCTNVANIAPVGTAIAGAGKWGQLDLAGDLDEWILDYNAPYVDPCNDCVFLTDFSYKVLRGGSWGTDPQNLFSAARGGSGDDPTTRAVGDGARCARSP